MDCRFSHFTSFRWKSADRIKNFEKSRWLYGFESWQKTYRLSTVNRISINSIELFSDSIEFLWSINSVKNEIMPIFDKIYRFWFLSTQWIVALDGFLKLRPRSGGPENSHFFRIRIFFGKIGFYLSSRYAEFYDH